MFVFNSLRQRRQAASTYAQRLTIKPVTDVRIGGSNFLRLPSRRRATAFAPGRGQRTDSSFLVSRPFDYWNSIPDSLPLEGGVE